MGTAKVGIAKIPEIASGTRIWSRGHDVTKCHPAKKVGPGISYLRLAVVKRSDQAIRSEPTFKSSFSTASWEKTVACQPSRVSRVEIANPPNEMLKRVRRGWRIRPAALFRDTRTRDKTATTLSSTSRSFPPWISTSPVRRVESMTRPTRSIAITSFNRSSCHSKRIRNTRDHPWTRRKREACKEARPRINKETRFFRKRSKA